jgi:hypothetical protein
MLSGPFEPLFNATEMVDRNEIVDPEPIVEVGFSAPDQATDFSDRLLDRGKKHDAPASVRPDRGLAHNPTKGHHRWIARRMCATPGRPS